MPLIIAYTATTLWLLLAYSLIRLGYTWSHWREIGHLPAIEIWWAAIRGIRFDASAIAMSGAGAILVALVSLAFSGKIKHFCVSLSRWAFVLTQTIFISANVIDIEYTHFTGKRLTWDSLKIVRDIGNQAGQLVLYYWFIPLISLAIAMFLFRISNIFTRPLLRATKRLSHLCLAFLALAVTGLLWRGGLQAKPLQVAHALTVGDAAFGNMVLNSTFTFLRTGKFQHLEEKSYMSETEMRAIMRPADRVDPKISVRPNIVLIILESFGLEFTGLVSGQTSYTPFLDSMESQGAVVFRRHFANGRRSIDAIPALTAGIPGMMSDAFATSAYFGNTVDGVPKVLESKGYQTAFFHGGYDGTMYFDLMAEKFGFRHYFGSKGYPVPSDDDGAWGIWDEPFLKYMAASLDSFSQPFFSAVFTLTSHHPYKVPAVYENAFPAGTLPIHKTIGYADMALRKFFDQAKTKTWYDNTLFLITADHTAAGNNPNYLEKIGLFRVPLIWFDPGRKLPIPDATRVTQHVDIPSTIRFLATGGEDLHQSDFGFPILSESATRRPAAVLFEPGRYWIVHQDTAIELSDQGKLTKFRWETDPRAEKPQVVSEQDFVLTKQLQSTIQYFHSGMVNNTLVW